MHLLSLAPRRIARGLVLVCLALALFACGRSHAADDGADGSIAVTPPPAETARAPHPMKFAAAYGDGFQGVMEGGAVPFPIGPSPLLPDAGGAYLFTQYGPICGDGGLYCNAVITADQIAAAFAVSLSTSGGGTVEVGQTCTPTYSATPATNAASVTGCTIQDNQGNGPTSVSQNNPISAPSSGHSYALTNFGTVTATVYETQLSPSVTQHGSATGCTYDWRYFYGLGTDSGTGTFTLSVTGTTNAALGSRGSGTLTGALGGGGSNSYVGTVVTVSPSSQYVFFVFPHTSTAHTFKDQNGFTFNVNVVQTISFTNFYSQTVSVDLYESATPLNASYTVTMTGALSPLDLERARRPDFLEEPPANDCLRASEAA